MKRNREIHLSPADRKRMLLVGAAFLPVLAFGVWIHLSNHSVATARERVVRTNGDLYVPARDLNSEKVLLVRVERGGDEAPVTVFLKHQDDDRPIVTLAACRRCNQAGRPSYVLNGRLICGHCGEAMPILAKGASLPKERDCTPLPIRFEQNDGSLIVRRADMEETRHLLSVQ